MEEPTAGSTTQPLTDKSPKMSPPSDPRTKADLYFPPPSYVLLPVEADEQPRPASARSGRTYLAKRQRGSDAIAIGTLLLYLPNFLYSLLVMALLPWLFHTAGLMVLVVWLLSGALAFWRRAENVFAHRLLRMRRPTPDERTKLEPAWQEVSARAGVQASRYELWVENSGDLNTSLAGGHIVGITDFALCHLQDSELAAMLARELSRQVRGHSWSLLLGRWYAVPGELVWATLRAGLRKLSKKAGVSVTGLVLLALLGFAVMTAGTLYALPLLLLATPYLLAYVHRRAELRADRHAATLGFGTALVSALERVHAGDRKKTSLLKARARLRRTNPVFLQRLLATHPEHHIRVQRLIPLLETDSGGRTRGIAR